MSEYDVLQDMMVAASRLGARLFRNNTGTAWIGNVQHFKRLTQTMVNPGDVVIRQARPLHAGLCKGSSDLIGWVPVEITQAHVGQTLAVFAAPEVKVGKTAISQDQRTFISVVNLNGGCAGVVYTVEELEALIQKAKSPHRR